ncbi:MAG: TIGR03960 family B12-binding radical SAM protein [Caldicoprobacter oshimai]
MDKSVLEEILRQVSKPVRYMGNEYNMVEKDPSKVLIRFAFAFPDVYEVGMSHLGMKILYHLMNEREDTYCERVFAPWTDMEQKMREKGLPLFALETRDPIAQFDFVGFTLQYEMCYTNVINMLDLAGIPLRWWERGKNHPFIIAGGPCAYNVEPLADFFDLVVMGDGEEVINELLDAYRQWKIQGGTREDFLVAAAQLPGVYVPRFYDVEYNDDGTVRSIKPNREGIPSVIQKRVVKDLDKAYYPETMIVPYMDIVHDRVMLEVFRGCTRGCRFCQAGIIYRPVRERSVSRLMDLAAKLISNTGYEELSLSSLSTSDYSDLENLVKQLMERFGPRKVSFSLPSLRIDSFSRELIEEMIKVRKAGLTFAPEAGTQRLRDVINKGVTEEDLLNSVRQAFELGWDTVKLYFMIGLPTETQEDLEGIADLARKVKQCYFDVTGGQRSRRLRITVSAASFVPKPFTPFQWVAQDPVERLNQKLDFLKDKLRIKSVEFDWHDPRLSFLEAVFARGDRRLGKVLLKAWKMGCKFDGWAEHFKYDAWLKAFDDTGMDPKFYANRARSREEVLPWSHIDVGVTPSFLWREYQKALKGELTPDCRERCWGCGITRLGGGLCQ